jgi:catalase-peroxidase
MKEQASSSEPTFGHPQDPIYGPIAKRFHEHPDQLADAFAKAWYKLLHRDMGPVSCYLGPWIPEPQLWHDPRSIRN